jgi:hypothetical protein
MRGTLTVALATMALAATGCGSGTHRADVSTHHVPHSAAGAIRSPAFHGNMDTNPANLASAVVTHAFGQLPDYIDDARFRLLPFQMFRTLEPGRSLVHTIRVTTPRTSLVLDTVVSSGQTGTEARLDARAYSVSVSVDRRLVPAIGRYWIYYRNNGPQICRIYFPGDLSSLNMAVQSLVLRPLTPGRHELSVAIVRRSPGSPPARLTTRYVLNVLSRAPSKAERDSAPEEDGPKPPSNTPLSFLAANTRR